MSTISEAVAAFEAAGGSLTVERDDIKVTYPKECREALAPLLHQLRARKAEVKCFVLEKERIHSARTPTLYRQKAQAGPPFEAGVPQNDTGGFEHPKCPQLPPGVRSIRYQPKSSPVAVAPVSIVTDVDKFICAYLRDLRFRLEHPKAYACAPLYEILAKLAEVGLELEIDASPRP